VRAVETTLGVSLHPGGTHPGMGTHNCLLRLGPTTYLEVIAPDPDAARPAWPRWFGLDRLSASHPARLAGWVARCDDVHALTASCTETVGSVQAMTRGDLAWQITIRSDGELPLGGAAPALMEWKTQPHPAGNMPDVGCSLAGLTVFHPEPEQVQGLFLSMALQSPPPLHWSGEEPPYLVAALNTPHGQRVLDGRIPAGS